MCSQDLIHLEQQTPTFFLSFPVVELHSLCCLFSVCLIHLEHVHAHTHPKAFKYRHCRQMCETLFRGSALCLYAFQTTSSWLFWFAPFFLSVSLPCISKSKLLLLFLTLLQGFANNKQPHTKTNIQSNWQHRNLDCQALRVMIVQPFFRL